MSGKRLTAAQRRREALRAFMVQHRADVEELAELEAKAAALRAKIQHGIDRIGQP